MKLALKKSQENHQELPEGLSLIKPHVDILKSIPAVAWDSFKLDYQKNMAIYEPTLKAGIIHTHMKQAFQDASITTVGLNYFEAYPKQHMLIAEKKVLIRFKKMDENYNTSNIPTKVQKKLENGQVELFDNDKLNHFVEVGYVPNPTWEYFDKIIIKEVAQDEPKWVLEFDKNLNFINSSIGTFDMFEQLSEKQTTDEEIELKIKNR